MRFGRYRKPPRGLWPGTVTPHPDENLGETPPPGDYVLQHYDFLAADGHYHVNGIDIAQPVQMPPHFLVGAGSYAVTGSAASLTWVEVGGGALIHDETDGLGIDFTYDTDASVQMAVKDTGTPVNTGDFNPFSKSTYTGGLKIVRQSDGVLRYVNHNLNLQSQTLDNAAWTTSAATVTANSTTAPDGTSTADTVTLTADGYIRTTNTISIVAGVPHIARVYAKKAAVKNWFVFSVFDATTPATGTQAFFDIVNGVAGTTANFGSGWSISSTSITDAGSGWWLCSITFNPNAATVVPLYHPGTADGDGSRASGDAVYVWGAQVKRAPVEHTTALADYIPTTTTARYGLPYEWDEDGDAQGLRLEQEARTNLVLHSQAINTTVSAWTHTEVTVSANSTAAPDGTTTAETVTPSTNNALHEINPPTVTVTENSWVTASVFAKKNGYTKIAISPLWPGHAATYAYFDLDAGTVGSAAFDSYGLTEIEEYTNGWYRCIVKVMSEFGQTTFNPHIVVVNADPGDGSAPANFAGNGSSGVYLWGAQAEIGFGASTYIATAGASVARTADALSIATSVIPFDATEGSLWVQYVAKSHSDTTAKVAMAFHDGTADERISAEYVTGEGRLRVVDGGSGQCLTGSKPGPAVGEPARIAARWAANDFAVASNGDATVGVDTSGSLPTVTTLSLGYTGFIGHMQKVFYAPRLLTNAALIAASDVADVTLLSIDAPAVAINGATDPIYTSSSPAAVYDESVDTTFFAWEGWDGGRVAYISSYNHTTGAGGTAYDTAITTLTDDDHGVPTIVKDHQGYWHAFGGSHTGALQHSSTNAANDISAWTARTEISGTHSYSKPVLMGSTLYVFTREANAEDLKLQLTVSTGLGSGVATWGSTFDVVNLDLSVTPSDRQRVYAGNFLVVGDEIWFAACRGEVQDNYRKDVYFFRYDTGDGSMKNYSGSVTVASGSLPVLKTTADASFRVYDHANGAEGTDIPQFVLDDDNVPYVFYATGPDNGVGPYDVFMAYPSGGTWTIEDTTVNVTNRYDVFAPVYRDDGTIDLYYPSVSWSNDFGNPDALFGGNLAKITRSAGGAWGSPTVLLTPVHRSIGRVAPVLNAHDNAQVFAAESIIKSEDDVDAGFLRVFLYGDDGFVSIGSSVNQAGP